MEFEFYNKRSERLYKYFYEKDTEFKQYFDSLKLKKYFYSTNKIQDNNYISLITFQAVEIYSSFNKKEIKNNFYRFAKLAAYHDKQKYTHLKKTADKIIANMVSKKYTRISDIMQDFDFEINQKVIKKISVVLDVIGSGLYKIGYNIYLQDNYNYKYWLLMVNNYPNLLEIKNIPLINKNKITFHKGDYLKTTHIVNYKKTIKREINKFIKNVAPGVFTKLYKNIPIVIVINYEEQKYFTRIKNMLFEDNNLPEGENTSFKEILRNDSINDYHEFYYNRNCFDTYIPSKINNILKPIIFSKHIRKPKVHAPTNLLFWLEILTQLYKIQLNQIDDIQNNYIYNTIKNRFFGLSNARKNLYRTDALLRLLEGSYEIEKNNFEEPYSESFKYYLNDSDEFNEEYFAKSLVSINISKNKIRNIFPKISEIYDKKNQDNNNKSNVFFQIIAIILTIFIIAQTIYQCELPRKDEDRNDRNINPKNNTIIIDNEICYIGNM